MSTPSQKPPEKKGDDAPGAPEPKEYKELPADKKEDLNKQKQSEHQRGQERVKPDKEVDEKT